MHGPRKLYNSCEEIIQSNEALEEDSFPSGNRPFAVR